MPIVIYNSLTRQKEEFKPINPPQVKIYTCGVTVYDESHLGHARSLYIFDVIRRYLEYRGFKVKFVRNITDIDDKIINRANELKINWQDLVEKYIERYYEDLKALGIARADDEPRATRNIAGMIADIKVLVGRGFAYLTPSGVYFSVRKFAPYGKLSGQSIDQMSSGGRIEPDEKKQDPLDFALWKASKPGEPYWPSPWGNGRPGWHIECSTMSLKYLKTDTLDIHAGGRDLIFPHHENEIAQAESLTGKPFARVWLHHGLLTINGQKMAKSLGNFISIKDILKEYSPDVLKMFFLSAHYASPIDFTKEKMQEARQALGRISILKDKINRKVKGALCCFFTRRNFKEIDDLKAKFICAMDDDFNTPEGLAAIFALLNLANKNIEDRRFISAAWRAIKEMLGIFGINLKPEALKAEISDEEIKAKIAARNAARKNKDYALSDKIRKELEDKGVILEDAKDGTIWRKKL